MKPHLDEGVAVLRSKEDSEIQALDGAPHIEQRRTWIQIDARPLAPHLARLRHMAQRLLEQLQRHRGTPQSTMHALTQPLLVH